MLPGLRWRCSRSPPAAGARSRRPRPRPFGREVLAVAGPRHLRGTAAPEGTTAQRIAARPGRRAIAATAGRAQRRTAAPGRTMRQGDGRWQTPQQTGMITVGQVAPRAVRVSPRDTRMVACRRLDWAAVVCRILVRLDNFVIMRLLDATVERSASRCAVACVPFLRRSALPTAQVSAVVMGVGIVMNVWLMPLASASAQSISAQTQVACDGSRELSCPRDSASECFGSPSFSVYPCCWRGTRGRAPRRSSGFTRSHVIRALPDRSVR